MRPMILALLAGCSDYDLAPKTVANGLGEPDIVVEPSTLAFTTTAVGCDEDRTVHITNVGDAALTLSGTWILGSDSFSAEFIEATLNPDETIPMRVRYHPTAAGRVEAQIIVASDDPDDPESVVDAGAAAAAEETVYDAFVQLADPVDVLFVIDNSSSMLEEQARVIAEISAFFSWFETLNLDYHMGVVTSDIVNPVLSGRLYGSPAYIDPNTPEAQTELGEAINVGSEDMGNEAGLRAVELALSEPVLSAENAGFLRADARLAIIVLSDEPEQSEYDAQHYIDFLGTVKADPSHILVSAIVGDYGAGCATTCDGAAQSAQAGDKYLDVVTAFSGVFGSICTCDLSPTLDQIGMESTVFARSFVLSDLPSDATRIRVWLDGTATSDWAYDASANAIVFGTAPINEAQVDVEYPVALTCDDI